MKRRTPFRRAMGSLLALLLLSGALPLHGAHEAHGHGTHAAPVHAEPSAEVQPPHHHPGHAAPLAVDPGEAEPSPDHAGDGCPRGPCPAGSTSCALTLGPPPLPALPAAGIVQAPWRTAPPALAPTAAGDPPFRPPRPASVQSRLDRYGMPAPS